jgi:putatice virulence related protein PagC
VNLKILSVLTLISISLPAFSSERTVSIGYLSVKNSHVKSQWDYDSKKFSDRAAINTAISNGYDNLSAGSPSDPKGLYISFRDEAFGDWGYIVQAGYAIDDTSSHYGQDKLPDGNALKGFGGDLQFKSDYAFVGTGPTYRISKQVSLYAIVLASYSHYSYDQKHYQISLDGKRSNLFDYSNSDSKVSAGFNVGAQFNVYKGLVVDAGYLQSGAGDWQYKGFNVGLGYKF